MEELDFRQIASNHQFKDKDNNILTFKLFDDNKTCEVSGFFTGYYRIIEDDNSAATKKNFPNREKSIMGIVLSGGTFFFRYADLNDWLYSYKDFLLQNHKKAIKSLDLKEGIITIEYEKIPIKSHISNLKDVKKDTTKKESISIEED